MKKYRSEGPVSYSKYQFSYTEWAQLEGEDFPGEAYRDGYLPYSGDPEDPRHLFYMARSLRVNLAEYSLKKSRRYDHREWSGYALRRSIQDKKQFIEKHGHEAKSLAEKWMAPRFGDKALSMERLAYILGKAYQNQVLTWNMGDRLCAYALLASGSWGAHYWYVFYENGSQNPSPPGHGYLVDFLDWAQSEKLPHAYIGTAYAQKSQYKSRGIRGIQFWDGNGWNTDKDDLKRRQMDDELRIYPVTS